MSTAVEIRAACSPGEIRAVVLSGDTPIDLAIERPGAPEGVGDRLRGRVLAHVPAMAGAFVALPGGEEGFLPDSAGGAGLVGGAAITVTVIRAAQGTKGPRLSAHTQQAEPGPPARLEPGPGAIARLLALHPGAPVLIDDAAYAPPGARIVPRAWDGALEAEIASLADSGMPLPGGGWASIHPTPALVAIDLDAGSATASRQGKAQAQKALNLAALPALAAAIRLRNLSGGIVIDLAGMAVKARTKLAPGFITALAGDPLHPQFLGFTALGFAEIRRPRIYRPLHEILAGPHAAGLAALRHLVRESDARPASSWHLRAHPDVVRALENDTAARADVRRRTGRDLVLQPDPRMTQGTWTMEAPHG